MQDTGYRIEDFNRFYEILKTRNLRLEICNLKFETKVWISANFMMGHGCNIVCENLWISVSHLSATDMRHEFCDLPATG